MVKKKHKTKQKVLIALSGGIDSAVSAVLLLRAGYEVEAAFMKNWSSSEGLVRNECPWIDDRREALKVAAQLGIVLHTFDFEKEYSEKVMQYFFKEYALGRTPNPDVMCNKEIKFKLLYNRAMKMGFDFMATGHYAQIKEQRDVYKLVRSADEFKDQTYFIYNLKQEQLAHVLFPIGKYKKTEVRKLAQKIELPNADRKESMGLCFVGKIKLSKFLQQNIKPKIGEIVTVTGEKIGKHNGVWNYTLGQRQGLNVGGSGAYYVVRKEITTNTLVVTNNQNDKALLYGSVQVAGLNWIHKGLKFPLKCKARFRHQQQLQDVELAEISKKGAYNVKFKRLQRAVASGQSIVFYKGKECLGGGVIQ